MGAVLDEILLACDKEYKLFSEKLIPDTKCEILGLRASDARKIAKKFVCLDTGLSFLSSPEHVYHDENMVHAYMLGYYKGNDALELLCKFLPYIDNWATCDSLCASLKGLFKQRDAMLDFIKDCIKSKHTYTVRFGLVCLLDYYIEEKYIPEITEIVKSVKSEEYYINMALAWLVSVMLVKEYSLTLPILKAHLLSKWVHNKAIQKARESYRISGERKAFLSLLKY